MLAYPDVLFHRKFSGNTHVPGIDIPVDVVCVVRVVSRARLTIYRERREANGRTIRNPRYVRTDSAFSGMHRESIGVSESRPDSLVGNVLVHYRRSEIEFPWDGSAA